MNTCVYAVRVRLVYTRAAAVKTATTTNNYWLGLRLVHTTDDPEGFTYVLYIPSL